jgi:hypothetical protein
VPVVTIVNGVNNEQVGPDHRVRARQPEEDQLPLVPAGVVHRPRRRVTPERRAAQRYTLSHLAHDVKNQTGIGEPVRDWFPISFMGSFTDWADVTHGAEKEFGPADRAAAIRTAAVGMAIMIDKETEGSGAGHGVPEGRAGSPKDVAAVSDAGPRPLPVGGGHGARAGAATTTRSSRRRTSS